MGSPERCDLNLDRKIRRQDKIIGKTPVLILGDMGLHTISNIKCKFKNIRYPKANWIVTIF